MIYEYTFVYVYMYEFSLYLSVLKSHGYLISINMTDRLVETTIGKHVCSHVHMLLIVLCAGSPRHFINQITNLNAHPS